MKLNNLTQPPDVERVDIVSEQDLVWFRFFHCNGTREIMYASKEILNYPFALRYLLGEKIGVCRQQLDKMGISV